MDDRVIDSIFAGLLDNLPPVSSKIVRIFTSSTFTGTLKKIKRHYHYNGAQKSYAEHIVPCLILDTTMERNTLMAQCYPKLKDFCREKHGLEFQVRCFLTYLYVQSN